MVVHSSRTLRRTDDFTDLTKAQVIVDPERHRQPLLVGEALHGLPNASRLGTESDLRGRVESGRREGVHVFEFTLPPPSHLAEILAGLVSRDGQEPCPKGGLATKPSKGPEGFDETILARTCRKILLSKDGHARPKDGAVMPIHKQVRRVTVSSPSTLHQLLV